MQAIRQWALVLCVAAIGTSVLQSVLPEKGSYSVIKLVLGLYILITLLSPLREFSAADLQLDFSISETEIPTADVTAAVLDEAETALENQLSAALAAENLPASEIMVDLVLNEEGQAEVDSVVVASTADENQIKMTVESGLGCETEVTVLPPDGTG